MAVTTEDDIHNISEAPLEHTAVLVHCLSAGETEKASAIFSDVKYEKCIVEDSSSIIEAVKQFVTRDVFKKRPNVFQCVQDILMCLAQKAIPENLLLEFVELGETLGDDTVLIMILKPLQIVLDRLQKNRGFSLMWCLNMIEQHVKKLPAPESHNLEGEETKLLDCDPNVEHIVSVYRCIEPFYSHFISQITAKTAVTSFEASTQITRERKFLIRSIIMILGHPFIHTSLRLEGHSKSESRVIAENLVRNLFCIANDLLKFLEYTEVKTMKIKKRDQQSHYKSIEDALNDPVLEQPSTSIFGTDEEIPMLGLGTLYYLILGEHFLEEILPSVYNPIYVFHKNLLLSAEMLKCSEQLIIYKGLILAHTVTSRIAKASLTNSSVETEIHSKFLGRLQPVMVYCPTEENRKLAVSVFEVYLSVLDRKCLYLLLVHLSQTAKYSAVNSFLVTYLKNVMLEEMKINSDVSPYFKGRMLQILVKKCCTLPEGAETDLLEHMSRINSVLNFIRYMVMRDKENKTGFLDCLPELKQSFLNPLGEALKLSRSHYELKLKEELENKKNKSSSDKSDGLEIKITVAGKLFEQDPVSTIKCSLTYFDLIESLLCRVNECLESL
ncbi:glomulin isoform X1 [Schistocerca cancellata]|uniref:glomulin isoform X1 n=1 Tax=Schistocerca cancellata TaxID=274614 RepID=UPI002118A03C|nr:glomulin isoform X1 [Schistocerca cancellata]XP_049779092.1 glomulin isoform X1 [Schistocerca cancellata]XP_049779093.1 glomulin isoform X1 [Schistocerca cancellata]